MNSFFTDNEERILNQAIVASPAIKLGSILKKFLAKVTIVVGALNGTVYPVTIETGQSKRLVRYWLSTTAEGAPYTNFGNDIALGTSGLAVTVDSEALTDSKGKLVLNVLKTNSQAVNVYLVTSIDGVIYSSTAIKYAA